MSIASIIQKENIMKENQLDWYFSNCTSLNHTIYYMEIIYVFCIISAENCCILLAIFVIVSYFNIRMLGFVIQVSIYTF